MKIFLMEIYKAEMRCCYICSGRYGFDSIQYKLAFHRAANALFLAGEMI